MMFDQKAQDVRKQSITDKKTPVIHMFLLQQQKSIETSARSWSVVAV